MYICESSQPSNDACQPINCSLNEKPADARFVSTGSTTTLNSTDASSGYVAIDRHPNFFADYEMLRTILGAGGHGIVRECIHRASGEKYAVKTIEKSKIARHDHIRREIELLCSIDHPGIMKIVDFYEDAACVHIITEMYTGGELFDAVINNTTEHGCLPEFAAVEIIKSLLEAVRYLHDNDIVHRDIKAENILFVDEECSSIKLIDFGLSRNHGQNDAYTTNPVGSPYYQSPGILTHKYDRSCDLWSIGVLTYILICGYPPFNGASNDEVHNATLDGNVVFEERIWGKFSRESIDFVRKLLCTDARKIGTAAEALDHPWIVHS